MALADFAADPLNEIEHGRIEHRDLIDDEHFRFFDALGDPGIVSDTSDSVVIEPALDSDSAPRMDSQSMDMRRRDTGRRGYGKIDTVLAQVCRVAVDRMCLARSGLTRQKDMCTRPENRQGFILSHKQYRYTSSYRSTAQASAPNRKPLRYASERFSLIFSC